MDNHERKVFLLPTDLLVRLRSYQSDMGIASEVETARRLLTFALNARDRPDDLVARLKSHPGSLREDASDVLVSHHLVTSIRFLDDAIEFDMLGLTTRVSVMEKKDA